VSHSQKILAQTGISLADVYNVQGSQIGVEHLDATDVKTVHEMGGTIFSERLSLTTRRQATSANAQNLGWNHIITDLPLVPWRLLGVTVIVDEETRMDRVQVSLRDSGRNRDFPVWVWSNADGDHLPILIDMSSGTPSNEFILVPERPLVGNLPSIGAGSFQPQIVDQVAFRGQTSGFGAGTVVATLLFHIAFADIGGVSSFGLPIPGW